MRRERQIEPPPKAAPAKAGDVDRSERETNVLGWLVSMTFHLSLLLVVGMLLTPRTLPPAGPLKLEIAHSMEEVVPEQDVTFEIEEVDSAQDAAIQNELEPIELAPQALSPISLSEAELLPTADPNELFRQGLAAMHGGAGQTSGAGVFFGTKAYGNRFVYVLDKSGSMGTTTRYQQTRFAAASRELVRSVRSLRDDQSFFVILFSTDTVQMFGSMEAEPELVPADDETKDRLEDWLGRILPQGGTDPRHAVRTALLMKPDAVFLLSDGKFTDMVTRHGRRTIRERSLERLVFDASKNRIPIHTFAFQTRESQRGMRALAKQTGGEYRFIDHNHRIGKQATRERMVRTRSDHALQAPLSLGVDK